MCLQKKIPEINILLPIGFTQFYRHYLKTFEEQIMFHKVLIFNAKGKLKGLLTREMLSKRHWELFDDNSKLNPKKNKDPRARRKNKTEHIFETESFKFEHF